jgi:hypothetical protein
MLADPKVSAPLGKKAANFVLKLAARMRSAETKLMQCPLRLSSTLLG